MSTASQVAISVDAPGKVNLYLAAGLFHQDIGGVNAGRACADDGNVKLGVGLSQINGLAEKRNYRILQGSLKMGEWSLRLLFVEWVGQLMHG